MYNLMPVKNVNTMEPGECFRDNIFILTESWNQFLRDHLEIKRKLIIASSFFMDFLQLTGLLLFYMRFNSFRGVITFGIFFPMR